MTDVQWQVSGPAALVLIDWGEEVAVYHTGSGDTHLVTPFAAHLLRTLESGACGLNDLVSSLSEVSFESDMSVQDMIQRVLTELYRLNIIEQVLI